MAHKRLRLNFNGTVQGVGFRPHIFRVATSLKLSGFVYNLPDGVLVEIEGPENALNNFITDLKSTLPPAARIDQLNKQEIPSKTQIGTPGKFEILKSQTIGLQQLTIGPDSATCSACLTEMLDPGDRRFGYPFINCTDCGPRLTIINGLPYDRKRTSMAVFPLCQTCQAEYDDPERRRFHAEATACPGCGPKLTLCDNHGLKMEGLEDSDKILKQVRKLLKKGKIIAIKGLGGFHLAVDASSHDAVKTLRQRKHRDSKPFALMVKDIETAETLTHINESEKKLLLSPSRPIVLLNKNEPHNSISQAVAAGLSVYGIMLPYTPLHHLLFAETNPIKLVMTSANLNAEPIAIDNREAQFKLAGIADYFLMHDRDIVVRLDDSVTFVTNHKPQIIRRSRGYVPQSIPLNSKSDEILALGGHLKNCLCLIKGKEAIFSPHIGDLDTPNARDFFHENIALIEKIGLCHPKTIACDLHPDYYSSMVAAKMSKKKVIRVQHHHAHIVSCMADNQISGQVLGLALDGTGLGLDGKIWGGEFLCADQDNFTRLGQLAYFPLPGGEKALIEPWRCALGLMKLADEDGWLKKARQLKCTPKSFSDHELELLLTQTANRPLTSSLGRFFDAVAAILGFSGKTTYEGQAAIELETLATQNQGPEAAGKITDNYLLPWEIIGNSNKDPDTAHYQLNLLPMIENLTRLKIANHANSTLAKLFHSSIVAAIMTFANRLCQEYKLDKIVLSGGCFQNRLLLEGCKNWPDIAATIYCHQQVPTNDGGLALGQALIAAARIKPDQQVVGSR